MTTAEAWCTCITCSDQGIEMQVEAVDASSGLAVCVGAGGERSEVDVGLVEGARPGSRVLVHAGTAIAMIAEVAR